MPSPRKEGQTPRRPERPADHLCAAFGGADDTSGPGLCPRWRRRQTKLPRLYTLHAGSGLGPDPFGRSSTTRAPSARLCRHAHTAGYASGLQVAINQSIVGTLWITWKARPASPQHHRRSRNVRHRPHRYLRSGLRGQRQCQRRAFPGGALTMNGCTVIGKVYASLLSLVSDCIFWMSCRRRTWQRSLRCGKRPCGQPASSKAVCASAIYPQRQSFRGSSMRAAGPERSPAALLLLALRRGCLRQACPMHRYSIRRGADDGGEMGAFHFVQAPSRETDLRVRMQEYLPVGLEFGVFYEN